MAAGATVLFDKSHGQANWSQTGFSSRDWQSTFSAVAELFANEGMGVEEASSLLHISSQARVLVIPPATGDYNRKRQMWVRQSETLFQPQEICSIHSFLHRGGRLLAFGYRFGDSFTQSNLSQLFASLGCILNDDAIIDVEQLRNSSVLTSDFETSSDCVRAPWGTSSVLRWRSMASFTIFRRSSVRPLVLSPGGKCLCFNRLQRVIRFESVPIAVIGKKGSGRFALFGGPHAFETGPFGLVKNAANENFLSELVSWLSSDDEFSVSEYVEAELPGESISAGQCLYRVDESGSGGPTIQFLERLLHEAGTLKALSKPQWAA